MWNITYDYLEYDNGILLRQSCNMDYYSNFDFDPHEYDCLADEHDVLTEIMDWIEELHRENCLDVEVDGNNARIYDYPHNLVAIFKVYIEKTICNTNNVEI